MSFESTKWQSPSSCQRSADRSRDNGHGVTKGSSPSVRKRGSRADFAELVRAIRSLVDPYRPELHYMRGPGPKWHAKHARSAASETPALHGLARIKG